MFNHFFSAFFRGENLTTLALPNEGKGNASPGAGAGPAKPTLRSLPFTAGEESQSRLSMVTSTSSIIIRITTVHTDFAGWRLTGFAGRGAPL